MKKIKTKNKYDKEALAKFNKLKKKSAKIRKNSADFYSIETDCSSMENGDPKIEKLKRRVNRLLYEFWNRAEYLYFIKDTIYSNIEPIGGIFEDDFVAVIYDLDILETDRKFPSKIDFEVEQYTRCPKIGKKIDKEHKKMLDKVWELADIAAEISYQKPKEKEKEIKNQIDDLSKMIFELVELMKWINIKFLIFKEYSVASYMTTEAVKKTLKDRGYRILK